MANVSFALVLNAHQPAWNLEDLLQHREWEAKEILWAIDRIPRSLWNSEDVGRVHLALSGTLLEPVDQLLCLLGMLPSQSTAHDDALHPTRPY